MKLLKVGIVIIVLGLILFFGLIKYIKYRSNNIKDHKDLVSSIDKNIQKWVDENKTVGLMIGIVKNDRIFTKGYGHTSIEDQRPPHETHIYELASTSKLFTTSLLQILVDEGVVNMDDKISDILKSKVSLPEIAQNTTLKHLATHHSGFPPLPASFLEKMTDLENPYKDLVIEDLYNYLKTCDGKKTEGKFEYSNLGMGILGHVLSLKTGLSYEELVKQKLLLPLKMENTFITIDSSQKNIIQGYDENKNPMPIWKDDVLTGAGSFLSNTSDMLSFIKANLSENATSLSKSLIKTHTPLLGGETGLGWMIPSKIDELIGNKNIIWHNGMAGGYASFIVIDKVNKYGFIILSNKSVDVTNLGMRLTSVVRSQSFKD